MWLRLNEPFFTDKTSYLTKAKGRRNDSALRYDSMIVEMGPRVVKEHSTLDEGETGEDRNSQARKISSLSPFW